MKFACNALVLTGAVLAAAGGVQAQNPVFNAAFGRDLRGWTMGTTAGWSADDANGSPDSGSALVINSGSRNNGRGVYQCINDFAFVAGTQMEIGAKISYPERQTSEGWVAVGLNWHSEPDCVGSIGLAGPRAELDQTGSGFVEVSASFMVPDGVASATWVAYATKSIDEGALIANFDDFFLVPAGQGAPATPLYVAAAAHAPGAAGTTWRTDLEVQNPTAVAVDYTIELLLRDQDNSAPERRSFTLAAGASRRFEDVLDGVFGLEGAAALRVTPQQPTLMVSSRTFNQSAEGSFGQFVPGVPRDEAIVSGSTGRLIQLAQSEDLSQGSRTNIGFVNATEMTIVVRADLYDGNGEFLGSLDYELAPASYRQIDSIFGELISEEVDDGYAVLSTSTQGGRFFAYASVIDNRTGDAVCVQPARF